MRYVFGIRDPRFAVFLVAVVLGWSQPGMAAGYYNLGAFWKQPPSTGCAPLATRVQNQSNFQSMVTSVATPAFTETAGNLLVAAVYVQDAPQTITLSDTTGGANTWQPLTMYTNTNAIDDNVRLFYATNIVGGANTVTASVGSADDLWISVTEYSGISGGTLDANTGFSASASTTSLQAGTLTIPGTSPGDLIVAIFSDANFQPVATAGSGYVTVASAYDNYGYVMFEDNTSFSGTSAQATATGPATSSDWTAASAAFRVSCVPYSSFTPSSLAFDPSSPQGGSAAGGTSITITGQEFDPGATVSIGGAACNVTARSSTNKLTCTTGAAVATGVQPVVVTDTNGRQATLSPGFVYGTLGTEQWLGGIPKGWGWYAFSTTDPTTLPGQTGTMQDSMFNWPSKVVYAVTGGTGSLYVADVTGARVMKFNANGTYQGWLGMVLQSPSGDPLSLGCTSTVPGVGTPGWCTGGISYEGSGDAMFAQPNGLAVDSTSTYLYVADTWNHRIEKFNASTGAFLGWIGRIGQSNGSNCTTVGAIPTAWCNPGGGGQAESGTGGGAFDYPTDVAVGPGGTYLYVLDWGNSRIEQFTVAGAFVGWLGVVNSATGLGCAMSNVGCALGGAGAFSGGFVTGGSAKASTVTGGVNGTTSPGWVANGSLMIDSAGSNLYLANSRNHRIERYTLPSGTSPGWIGVVSATGANCTTASVYSGTWCAGGNAKSSTINGGLNTPAGVSTDGTYLYVVDNYNDKVVRYALNGSSPSWIGNLSTNGLFTGAWSTSNTAPSNTYVAALAGYAGGLDSPASVAVDAANGNLYAVDGSNNLRINRYTLSTGAYSSSLMDPPGAAPTGWMTGGPSVAGVSDSTFTYWNASGNFWDIALDTTNNAMYVVDNEGSRVMKYNLTTGAYQGWLGSVGPYVPTGGQNSAACTATGTGSPTPGWCTGGASEADGNEGGLQRPAGIAVDPTGTYIYVADQNDYRIERFKTADGTVYGSIGDSAGNGTGCAGTAGPLSGWCINGGGSYVNDSVDGALNYPTGLAVDSSGYLYVMDMFNQRIVKYDSTGAFQGWVGYGTNSGGTGGCPGATPAATTGWCKGGTSTTSSGNAPGQFNNAAWLTIDQNGHLWAFDPSNNRVQEYNASTGAYLSAITFSGSYQNGMGVDPAGTSLFSYEDFGVQWQAFTRYFTANGTLFGYAGNLATASPAPTYGQAGCPSVTTSSTPSLWCQGQYSQWWGGSGFAAPAQTSHFVIDSSNHYMYWVDSYNNRIARVPINQ